MHEFIAEYMECGASDETSITWVVARPSTWLFAAIPELEDL